ncbi:MAG: NAD-dependent epimerase/dehydratase family protein [Proteobacteria bacterium]|nr:NAD-dependent epimerase/dehydratase family protein [Pseudomonadota bacterium]MDA1131862.1 NAD-dependent epimerase/dehydratase family protein [Pseudomonadota bacterium]
MKIVVTGASGFIGGAVLHALADDADIEAVPVSRRPLPGGVRVADYTESPSGDVLLHLAGDPRADAGGASTVMPSLFDGRYRRVVLASTAALYGDATATPHTPFDAIRTPSRYTAGKRADERRTLERGGVVARIANVYGPGMNPGTVVSDILAQIPGDGPLRIGNGAAVRDFIWVGDVAAGLVAMARGAADGIYNLGTGIGTAVADLARLALDLAGEPARPVAAQSGSPSALVVDIGTTTGRFDWRPGIALADGLGQLLAARP